MSEDLEQMLRESGDVELGALVARLRAAPAARVPDGFSSRVRAAVHASAPQSFPRKFDIASALPLAAGLALLLGLGTILLRPSQDEFSPARLVACQRADGTFTATSAAPYVQAFAVTVLAREPATHGDALTSAVDALVRDQNAEGGWSNAALSARNVVALRQAADAGIASARRAYKRGLRYLRTHGIGELADRKSVV